MGMRIDGSLYPDEPSPDSLEDARARIDFLARLCGSWDFGVLPEADVLREIRGAAWRSAVDQCRLLTSPSYHLLRGWHALPPLPFLGSIPAYILEDPSLDAV